MPWQQITDPFHNLFLSALIAVIPVLFIFWALIIKKMQGYKASVFATALAILLAIIIYKMPVQLALLSAANGALYGLFPICWIIIPAVFLFNLTVKSGRFEVIKHWMASITPDRRIQAILIAFSFGSFLEGTAGFGAPVAITAAMLVGLGFNPLYASGICLLANTAPVAFGSIGIPITVASQVSDIPEMAISQMVGRTLPFLSLILPYYIVVMMTGFKKAAEVFPPVLVAGFSFAILQWSVSNFIGPALPDVIAGLGSIVCLIIFLKFWKPKTIWSFGNDDQQAELQHNAFSTAQVFQSLAPFLILTIFIIAWGLQPVKNLFNATGSTEFYFPGLRNAILDQNGTPLPHIFKLNYLSAAGTAIFLSACISVPILGLSLSGGTRVFAETLKQLIFPIITISAVLAFAYVLNDSGITLTMAAALAATGVLFPLFAPLLGWLGVFITGSDTSSNALFGKLQATTAETIGVDPVVTVGANISGGVVGKMISPQSIAVAAAAGGLVGKEADLFRFTVKHSFIMLSFISMIVLLQAYAMKWVLPVYSKKSLHLTVKESGFTTAYIYLFLLAVIVTIIFFVTKSKVKTKNQKS
jgi:lactate permease